MDKISYALGLSIGNNFRASGVDKLDIESFSQAIAAVLEDKEPAMSYDEAKNVINEYFTKLQGERLEINKKAGEEFLAINKNKEGVVTLPSGLQYTIVKKGEGKTPVASDTVKYTTKAALSMDTYSIVLSNVANQLHLV